METKTINFKAFLDNSIVHEVDSTDTTLKMIQYMNEGFVNYYKSERFTNGAPEFTNYLTMLHNDVNHLLLNTFRGILDDTYEVELYTKIADDCATWPGYDQVCNNLTMVIEDFIAAEQENGCIPNLAVVFAAKRLITSILHKYLQEIIRDELVKLRASSEEVIGVY
ncbi:hypothetical protein LZG74_16960 [Dyadobacter sp. CY327]|uniref:hypothetical protein n=1 Tax=Dyadobacter sp. CY327 TaxID=2907301 RepID=UPI001F311318|nr:hypothetical protein [Dyadobacter sp. CY327]MCE7072009.1 hypothetical protein [Dyadobacter sp. CY327]